MRNLQRMTWGRVDAIRKRVVKSPRTRRAATGGDFHPGFAALSEKLARASEQVRGNRHGRRPE
jgi:hypothetical protein